MLPWVLKHILVQQSLGIQLRLMKGALNVRIIQIDFIKGKFEYGLNIILILAEQVRTHNKRQEVHGRGILRLLGEQLRQNRLLIGGIAHSKVTAGFHPSRGSLRGSHELYEFPAGVDFFIAMAGTQNMQAAATDYSGRVLTITGGHARNIPVECRGVGDAAHGSAGVGHHRNAFGHEVLGCSAVAVVYDRKVFIQKPLEEGDGFDKLLILQAHVIPVGVDRTTIGQGKCLGDPDIAHEGEGDDVGIIWLKGHCGDAIRVDRPGREPEYIPNPALSAILTIQPVVLDEIMSNATMAGRGLIARFLYASPPSMIGGRRFCTPEIPAETSTAYKEMIYQLMGIPKPDEPTVLTLTPHATDVIAHHFHEHEIYLAGEGQMISDWASKYIGAVLRIAGLLHVAEPDRDDDEISSDTMRRAIQIGKYFLAHSAYAYSMMGNDLSIKKAQFVLGKLKKDRITSIKRWELAKLCRGKFFKKSEDLYPTLELLQSCGYILQTDANTQPTPGRRPDILVLVNPEIYKTTE